MSAYRSGYAKIQCGIKVWYIRKKRTESFFQKR